MWPIFYAYFFSVAKPYRQGCGWGWSWPGSWSSRKNFVRIRPSKSNPDPGFAPVKLALPFIMIDIIVRVVLCHNFGRYFKTFLTNKTNSKEILQVRQSAHLFHSNTEGCTTLKWIYIICTMYNINIAFLYCLVVINTILGVIIRDIKN